MVKGEQGLPVMTDIMDSTESDSEYEDCIMEEYKAKPQGHEQTIPVWQHGLAASRKYRLLKNFMVSDSDESNTSSDEISAARIPTPVTSSSSDLDSSELASECSKTSTTKQSHQKKAVCKKTSDQQVQCRDWQ